MGGVRGPDTPRFAITKEDNVRFGSLVHYSTLFALLISFSICEAAAPAAQETQSTSSVSPAEHEARWFRGVRQMTSTEMGLDRAGEAYFSPDGKRICFQAIPKANPSTKSTS